MIGIDAASQIKNYAFTFAIWDSDHCEIPAPPTRFNTLADATKACGLFASNDRTIFAVDAPLGWPSLFRDILSNHKAGSPIPVAADLLFSRETDRFVRSELSKKPLPVGAERIAYAARSALEFVGQLVREVGADYRSFGALSLKHDLA